MLSVTYRRENYEKAVQADPGFSLAREPFPRVLQVWVYIRRLWLHDEACTTQIMQPSSHCPRSIPLCCTLIWMQMGL